MITKSIVELYNTLAPVYDPVRPLWANLLAGRVERFLEQDILLRYLPAGAAILDIGCGTAANLTRLRRLGLDFGCYVGVDLTPGMLRRAVRQTNDGRATFYRGDATCLPFADGSFDFVLSTWMLSHIPRPGQVVGEALRVLKEGGHFALLFWSRPAFPLNLAMRPVEWAFRMRCPLPWTCEGFSHQIVARRFSAGSQICMVFRKGDVTWSTTSSLPAVASPAWPSPLSSEVGGY